MLNGTVLGITNHAKARYEQRVSLGNPISKKAIRKHVLSSTLVGKFTRPWGKKRTHVLKLRSQDGVEFIVTGEDGHLWLLTTCYWWDRVKKDLAAKLSAPKGETSE